MYHVIYVSLQNRKGCHFIPVIKELHLLLKCYILIFGVLLVYPLFMDTIMLKTKCEVHLSIQNFVAFAEKQFEAQINIIKTDNGAEFSIHQYFNSKVIIHQTTCMPTK